MVLLSFDPLLLLLWIALACFLPGAILSFSLFRESRFNATEKLFIGFGLGIILLPLIPFLLYLAAGIKYSYGIALLSVAVFYIIALALFIKSRAYEGMKIPDIRPSDIKTKDTFIPIILIIIILLTFWLRFVSYSPVFFELDPYYYTDIAQQLLVFGENPIDDQTAWYPDLVVSHRSSPELSYLEALWYSLYAAGGDYSNLLLAVIASVYPPIAAALAVFFLYLFLSISYRREWGLLAAGIASFIPIFLFKTAAGEMEVQPYAFFALAFFIAMYAAMIKEKKPLYAMLAGLGYLAVTLGSASEVVALTIMLLFIPLQSVFLFLKEKTEELKTLLVNNSIVFGIGLVLGSTILKGMFYSGALLLSYSVPFFFILVFMGVLYFLRERVPDKALARSIFALLVVIGLIVFLFTPLADPIKRIGASAVGIAKYSQPLDRTIAEQRPAEADLSGSFGFIAASYPAGVDALMGIISFFVNAILALMVIFLNWVLGTGIVFEPKSNSILLLCIGLFGIGLVYSLYRSVRRELTLVFLFAAVVFPPLLIGIIKAKYTIYAGFLLAAGIGLVFGEAEVFIKRVSERMESDEKKAGGYWTQGYKALLVLAAIVLILQFSASAGGFAPALLSQSFKTRFQDDPASFASKLQSMCTELGAKGVSEQSLCEQYSKAGFPMCSYYDEPVCTVAPDPVRYAGTGTNEQYNRKLCYYSLISDITSPKNEELIAASFRCKTLSPYWVESMEWIQENTPEGSRFTSWWDYGHWINFFGQRNTVLRNEHLSHFMIGEVAYAYLDGSPEELAAFMRSRNSSYAIFDKELTGTAPYLGGKYGALNYLMCARNNMTDVSKETGWSACEADHLWETVIVPRDPYGRTCTISEAGNKTGVLAYKAYWARGPGQPFLYTSMYPPGFSCYGGYLNDPNVLAFCQNFVKVTPAYCVGDVLLANNEVGIGTYLLNETYPNGDLKLNKAYMVIIGSYTQTLHLGDAVTANLFYTKDPLFIENGRITEGYDDRRTRFYSSNLYRALYLDELPGFTKVFQTKDQSVKIYKLNE